MIIGIEEVSALVHIVFNLINRHISVGQQHFFNLFRKLEALVPYFGTRPRADIYGRVRKANSAALIAYFVIISRKLFYSFRRGS